MEECPVCKKMTAHRCLYTGKLECHSRKCGHVSKGDTENEKGTPSTLFGATKGTVEVKGDIVCTCDDLGESPCLKHPEDMDQIIKSLQHDLDVAECKRQEAIREAEKWRDCIEWLSRIRYLHLPKDFIGWAKFCLENGGLKKEEMEELHKWRHGK